MARIEESIDVSVPVETAYNQWTQFEEFPPSWRGIEEVQQVDDTHLRWTARSAASAGVGRRDHRAASRPARRLDGDERQGQRRRGTRSTASTTPRHG